MMKTSLMTFYVTLLAIFAMVFAAPVVLNARDVYVPPITSPNAATTWFVGNYYDVTWDTSNPPVNITNKQGMVVLAKDQEMIDLDNPLAQGFNILDGKVQIQVPDVDAGDDYQVVLFGDSGNFSPTFTICR